MSQLEKNGLAPLARLDDEPVFDEPWQAQALGLAFVLAERGVYSPADWSRTLGAVHRKLLFKGSTDTPKTYYEAVVRALEQLIGETDTFSGEMIKDRVQTWRRAYLNTPTSHTRRCFTRSKASWLTSIFPSATSKVS